MRLYAAAKVRDTQYCKLGGGGVKVLKASLPSWRLNLNTKRSREEKLGCGVVDSSRTHKQLCINK